MKYDADAIKGYASIYWNGTKDERIAGMMLHDYAALIKEAHEIFTAKGSYDCKVDPRIEVEYQRAYGLLQKAVRDDAGAAGDRGTCFSPLYSQRRTARRRKEIKRDSSFEQLKPGLCSYSMRRGYSFCTCHPRRKVWFEALKSLREGNIPYAIRLLKCMFPSDKNRMIRKIELASKRMLERTL